MEILKCCGTTDSNIENSEENFDKTDKVPNSYHVTYWNLGSSLFSIILHLLDVAVDIYVTYSYFETKKYSYFAWSMAFIFLPSLIIALISIRMYRQDIENSARIPERECHSFVRIVLCVLGLILQSAPFIRNCDSLYYARKSLKAEKRCDKKEQEKYYIKMLYEDSDVALLRVFEAYLESAPQQVLQITLLLVDYSRGSSEHFKQQLFAIICGFFSMAWCMANYKRHIRFDRQYKKNISAAGVLVQIVWHLNFTVSRILAISAVATLYTLWTLVALVCHWCAMSIWLAVSSKTNFCGKHKIFEILFLCACGLIYIFNFINLKDGQTRKYYLIFFLLCGVENVITATIWGVKAYVYFNNWVYYIFIILPVVCFILGVISSVMYYNFLHPNRVKSDISNDKKSFYCKNMQINTHEQGITPRDEV